MFPYNPEVPPKNANILHAQVRLLRRQRDRHYQLELQRQIEDKRRLQQQRRRDEVRADLLRLGAADRHDEYVRQLHSEQRLQLQRQLQHQLHREEHREEQRMQQVGAGRGALHSKAWCSPVVHLRRRNFKKGGHKALCWRTPLVTFLKRLGMATAIPWNEVWSLDISLKS